MDSGRDEVHGLRCRTGDINGIRMINQVCKFGLEEPWRYLNTYHMRETALATRFDSGARASGGWMIRAGILDQTNTGDSLLFNQASTCLRYADRAYVIAMNNISAVVATVSLN